jgi:hypothetical protein
MNFSNSKKKFTKENKIYIWNIFEYFICQNKILEIK